VKSERPGNRFADDFGTDFEVRKGNLGAALENGGVTRDVIKNFLFGETSGDVSTFSTTSCIFGNGAPKKMRMGYAGRHQNQDLLKESYKAQNAAIGASARVFQVRFLADFVGQDAKKVRAYEKVAQPIVEAVRQTFDVAEKDYPFLELHVMDQSRKEVVWTWHTDNHSEGLRWSITFVLYVDDHVDVPCVNSGIIFAQNAAQETGIYKYEQLYDGYKFPSMCVHTSPRGSDTVNGRFVKQPASSESGSCLPKPSLPTPHIPLPLYKLLLPPGSGSPAASPARRC